MFMDVIKIRRDAHTLLINQYWLLVVNVHSKSLELREHPMPRLDGAMSVLVDFSLRYTWYRHGSHLVGKLGNSWEFDVSCS